MDSEPTVAAVNDTSTGYTGDGTASSPYLISTAEQFVELSENFKSTLKTSYIYLTDDLDFSEITLDDGYLLYYFYGVIYGVKGYGTSDFDSSNIEPITIKGLDYGDMLIYAWFGGYIQNITLDLCGEASMLVYLQGSINGSFYSRRVNYITVQSTGAIGGELEVVIKSDGYANYSPFQYTVAGNYQMNRCANYANISSTTYGGIFCGYYPLDTSGDYTFNDCVNYGDVRMRHVGMMFGNNTILNGNTFDFTPGDDDEQFHFTECVNKGTIYATDSEPKMFANQAAGSFDDWANAYEAILTSGTNVNSGTLEQLAAPSGMALNAADDGTLTITAPTSETDAAKVSYYVVSVYSYINMFKGSEKEFYGNLRYGVSQTIYAADLADGTDSVVVKNYGLCDYSIGTTGLTGTGTTINGVAIVNYNDVYYYWLNHNADLVEETSDDDNYYYYINRSLVEGVKDTQDIVRLAAYGSDDKLLGIVEPTDV